MNSMGKESGTKTRDGKTSYRKKISVKRQRNGLFLSLAAIVGIVAIFCRTIVLLAEMLTK